jgi:hypothetical protein
VLRRRERGRSAIIGEGTNKRNFNVDSHDPEVSRDRRRVFNINFVAAAARRQTRAHDVHTDHAGARGGMQYIAGPKDGRAHEA